MGERNKNRREYEEKKGEPTAAEEKDIDKRVMDYWLTEGEKKEKKAKRRKKEKRKGK